MIWTIDTTHINDTPIIDTYSPQIINKNSELNWLEKIIKISTPQQKEISMIKINSCMKYFLDELYVPNQKIFGRIDVEIDEILNMEKKMKKF